MKRYSLEGYSVLAGLPYSFQVSNDSLSLRLRDYDQRVNANNPMLIKIQEESLNENHALLYTPNLFMEISWIDDEYEPNGQIVTGLRTPEASMDFVQYTALLNGVPKPVIDLILKIIRTPENAKSFEVPLYKSPNSNNEANEPTISPPPPPPPPPPPAKIRRFKIVAPQKKRTQRRRRNV